MTIGSNKQLSVIVKEEVGGRESYYHGHGHGGGRIVWGFFV